MFKEELHEILKKHYLLNLEMKSNNKLKDLKASLN